MAFYLKSLGNVLGPCIAVKGQEAGTYDQCMESTFSNKQIFKNGMGYLRGVVTSHALVICSCFLGLGKSLSSQKQNFRYLKIIMIPLLMESLVSLFLLFFSHVQLFMIQRTILSVDFSCQRYWSVLAFPSPAHITEEETEANRVK